MKVKLLKSALYLLSMIVISSSAFAHGPSPQKMVKEVVIKADQEKVWALVKDFASIGKWHPDVVSAKLENRKDAETGAELPHRLVALKNGTGFLEKLREVNEADKKIDYKMVEGAESTIAVSNYRTVMQVKPGASAGESILTITARFYNKANSMEAPPGQDNPTANKVINEIYDATAEGMKKALEK
jgi:mxaD protein